VDTGPLCPPELLYLWEWFKELDNGDPLTFSELKAWSEMTHRRLRDWEVTTLVKLSKPL